MRTNLCVKNSARFDRVVGVAEDEALRDVVLLDALQLDANVLAAFNPRHLNLVGPQLKEKTGSIKF